MVGPLREFLSFDEELEIPSRDKNGRTHSEIFILRGGTRNPKMVGPVRKFLSLEGSSKSKNGRTHPEIFISRGEFEIWKSDLSDKKWKIVSKNFCRFWKIFVRSGSVFCLTSIKTFSKVPVGGRRFAKSSEIQKILSKIGPAGPKMKNRVREFLSVLKKFGPIRGLFLDFDRHLQIFFFAKLPNSRTEKLLSTLIQKPKNFVKNRSSLTKNEKPCLRNFSTFWKNRTNSDPIFWILTYPWQTSFPEFQTLS
jgi:hypothetical protein